jgi:hypothetical protein
MPDLLATASAWLDQTLRTSVSQTVRYRRGAAYVDVLATFGLATDSSDASPEARRTWQSTDFMIAVADLVLAGHEVEPQVGDRIEFTPRTETITFQVQNDEVSGKCFSHCDDSTKLTFRIHTKEIG